MNPANNVNDITDDPAWIQGRDMRRAWGFFSLSCPQLLAHQKAYIRKIVETVNDLDNVLYEVCNEIPFRQEAFDWSDHIAQYVHDCEAGMPKQHPVGITAEGGDQDNANLWETCADWISPSNGRLFEYRYNPPAADGRKVVVNDTDHLWGIGCETAWIWKSFTRGLNALFMDPWQLIPGALPEYNDGQLSRHQRYYYGWDPVRRNLGYARAYALKMDLNACLPHGELCTSGYCLADPGREYLCFLPEGGQQGIDLWGQPGKYKVEWFDPATGKTYDGGVVDGDARHALGAPFAGMSVAYLKRSSSQ